ncbi:MAG: glycosyltransferase [Ruminococcus sp.]|nr:glycosyltransferase [Ruminococcus sp.]
MGCKFSVIVPIYNVEKFLPTCIESVLSQSFKDFELILVNDGSTDNSLSICEKYAEKDSRIKVINKKNEGLFLARKSGLKEANGEYVVHIDGDDSCEPELLSYLDKNINEQKPDLIIYNYNLIDENNNFIEVNISPLGKENRLFNGDEKKDILKTMFENYKVNNIWIKCGKREFYNAEETDEYDYVVMGEDVIYSMPLLKNTERIFFTPEPLYNYRVNRSGVSRRIHTKYIYDFLKVRKCFFQTIESLNYDDLKQPFVRRYMHGVCNYLMKLHLLNNHSQYKKIYSDVKKSEIQKTAVTYQKKWGFANTVTWFICNPVFYPVSKLLSKLYYKKV